MGTKPQLIETIRIQKGRVCNINYHNHRFNESRKILFASNNKINLRNSIDAAKLKSTLVKCRITYDDQIRKVEYEPYSIRPIQSLALIEIGQFEYTFKYADRGQLKAFFVKRGERDDILMTRNGFITDTYYANVALLREGKWYTPKFPLLKGSMRAQLLEKEKIEEAEIHKDQLNEFDSISVFNAMIPFKKIVIKF